MIINCRIPNGIFFSQHHVKFHVLRKSINFEFFSNFAESETLPLKFVNPTETMNS